jgi:hypothetical protein
VKLNPFPFPIDEKREQAMLKPEDKRAIENLFERLANVEQNSGPRDFDAEKLIWEKLRRNPEAAYYMAQTIIVQEAALREQQQRIAALEEDADTSGLGFLDAIFGDDRPQQRAPRRSESMQRSGDGGFLAGAAQTALGVTGGVLLGNAIAGLFGGSAHAGENLDFGVQDNGGADDIDAGGDDWGGGFDIGGEF